MQQRTNNFVLPDAEELMQLMWRESKRTAARHDYYMINKNVFDAYRKLMQNAHVDAEFIDTWHIMPLRDLLEAMVMANAAADTYIANHQSETDLFDSLYDHLSPSGLPQRAEAIYVFGSPFDVRIEKAIELYKAGFAPKIIVSGKGPNWGTNHISEADRMAEVARQCGVPDGALMLEPQSLTIVDNVKRALDMFDETNYHPASMIIVTSPYVMRRADSSWYRFPTEPIDIIRVAAESPSYQYTKEGWYKFENNRALVLNEYAKLFIEQKIDQLQIETRPLV